MHRFPIRSLRIVEKAKKDPGLLSETMGKLIYASQEMKVKIFDSDARNGAYVIVLEGVLNVGEWERALDDVGEDVHGDLQGSGSGAPGAGDPLRFQATPAQGEDY